MLVDTNIFLEILLDQNKKSSCKNFLSQNIGSLHISDFSLHSIGVILFRNQLFKTYQNFLIDILANVEIISLDKSHYKNVAKVASKYNLDFDDAYQTSIAIKNNFEIITMDKDFKRVSNKIRIDFLN